MPGENVSLARSGIMLTQGTSARSRMKSTRDWPWRGRQCSSTFRHRHQVRRTPSHHVFDPLIMPVVPSSAALRCCRHAVKLRSSTGSSQCLRPASTLSTSINRNYQRRRAHGPVLDRRWQSTDAAAVNPKISGIVDQIGQLTLLETADLVQSLKVDISRSVNKGLYL